ncbi:MAG TPA: DNA polymerase ligase N-terminal domain-containing protein [Longimicrobiales bacterium]|nr:DNA polymerase ligase N-terminal domain-containing protein [Longimicrobiales bacterium]
MDRLSEYRQKRDFGKTGEPSGSPDPKGRRRKLRFVIQKHAASHLHFDLRLELDGVMKSWAVPKGPSTDPAVKRLAMQVEDHPIEYNAFEGVIPEGQYGGGTVMLWDRGTYAPDEPRSGEADAGAVRRGLKDGKLSFTLHGDRLHGSFALVRTRRGEEAGSRPQWLLIKHRDEHATPGTDVTARFITSIESGRTMDEIATEKDHVWQSSRKRRKEGSPERRDGEGMKPAASTEPAAADTMLLPMRPTPARSMAIEGDWTYEPWRGGTRVLAWATADGTQMVDEAGHAVGGHAALADELSDLARRLERPVVLEGEIAPDDDGTDAFFATDILLAGDDVLAPRPWAERRAALEDLLRRRRLRRLHRPDTDDDPARMLDRMVSSGWPGLLARRGDLGYEPGERSDGLLRITG